MTPATVVAAHVSRLVRVGVPALMLLAAPAGCIKHSVIPDEPDVVTISVSNSNPLDMTVYAVNQSMRIRLGTVSTASTQRFTLQLHQISPTGELQLLADPVGSRRTYTSEPIHVFAGQAVEWVLQADLRQSSLTIRS
jgi:predicted acyl esterase